MKINILAENGLASGGVGTSVKEEIRLLEENKIEFAINSKEKCDILDAHTIGLRYIYYAKKYKGRCVVIAHTVPRALPGRIIFTKLLYPLIVRYMRYIYNLADVIIAVSPAVKRDLLSIGVESKIVVLPNGINRSMFRRDAKAGARFRKRYGLRQKDFVILCIGLPQHMKGIDTFIEVASRIPAYKFVWVGGNEIGGFCARRDEVREIIKNAPANVVFTGQIPYEEMNSAYSAADILFFPSLQEACSRAIIEAASCKLPLVLRDNPEYKDLYFNTYLKGKTIDEFVNLILRLNQDKKFYQKYSNLANSLAKKYNKDSYRRGLFKIHKELLSK